MASLVLDEQLEKQLIERRRACGGDRYDEVWDGVYVMPPLADNEHQGIVARMTAVLVPAVEDTGLGRVFPGANVSDQPEDWKYNYRCPDVVVVLAKGRAADHHTYLYGGPDFLIEIASPGDRTHEKLDFYSKIKVRELLIVDRDERTCELYRLRAGQLELVGRSDASKPTVLKSQVVPLEFCWQRVKRKARVKVTWTADPSKEWFV